MGFPDWSLILDEVLALAIVLAPLEIMILRNLAVFRTFMTGLLSSFKTKEGRQQLFTEIGHGMLRALKERRGSEAGVDARAQKAGILDSVLGGGGDVAGLLSNLPGKVDLPIVGKVTIGQAIEIAKGLRAAVGGRGGIFQGEQQGSSSSQATGAL